MKIWMKVTIFGLIMFFSAEAFSQTTAFNFQGRLNDGNLPANGRYDLQFKLFSAIAGGSQVGTTVDRPNLLLINGVFSTTIDFGGSAFTGGDRFIEMSVRPNGSPNPYVILGARQQILSVPYSVRATNAENAQTASDSSSLGGVAASSYARLNFLNNGNLQTSGNVGFGTVAPNTRLTLSGGPAWTSSGWTASMNMQNASAIGWEANGSGQRFGIGQANGGLHFFRTISPFGSTIAPAQIDLGISDNGHLTQPLDRNGAMKAMLAVTANGTIVRCYNGVTGATQNDCGFSVIPIGSPELPFGFEVRFPFDVNGRFWMVTAERSATGVSDAQTAGVKPDSSSNMVLTVEIHVNGSRAYRPFHLFVF